jgi:tetratricopeptide (TPR) repeat protein
MKLSLKIVVVFILALFICLQYSRSHANNYDCESIGFKAGLKGVEEFMIQRVADEHYRESQDCIMDGYKEGINFANAEKAYKNKDYSKALKLFLLNAQKGYVAAQVRAGELYFNGLGTEQNYQEAFKWYKLAADQGDGDAWFYLGVSYRNGTGTEKDAEKASEAFRKTVAKDPKRAKAWAYLALCYKEKGDYGHSLESINRALAISPENIEYMQVQATSYLLQGDTKNTKNSYEQLLAQLKIDIEKEKTAAKYAKASWYTLMTAHFADAERYANDGLALDAKASELHAYIGHAYLLQNSKREALLVYKKYMEQDTDQAALRNKLNDDFSLLKKRYPERASEIEWVENKLQSSR